MNVLDTQLQSWAANCKASINKLIYSEAKKLGYSDDDLKNNPKIRVKEEVTEGKAPGFNMFTYIIEDKRPLTFRSNKKRFLAAVEFTPSGYHVVIHQPLVQGIEKPALVNMAGEKIKSTIKSITGK